MDGIRNLFGELAQDLEDLKMKLDRLEEANGWVLASGQLIGWGGKGSAPFERAHSQLIRFSQGSIVEFRQFASVRKRWRPPSSRTSGPRTRVELPAATARWWDIRSAPKEYRGEPEPRAKPLRDTEQMENQRTFSLNEFPDYYPRLAEMEAQAERYWSPRG